MPYQLGDRVIVNLKGLTSLTHRKGTMEAEGTVLQRLGPGFYDVLFYPRPPYHELTIASYVPEGLLRPVGSRPEGSNTRAGDVV